MTSRYGEALELAERAEAAARQADLPFAIAHIGAVQAASMLRFALLETCARYRWIHFMISLAIWTIPSEVQRARAARRVFLAEAKPADAAAVLKSWSEAPTPQLRAECAALRSLALALLNQQAEARTLAETARRTTRDAQAQTLSSLALRSPICAAAMTLRLHFQSARRFSESGGTRTALSAPTAHTHPFSPRYSNEVFLSTHHLSRNSVLSANDADLASGLKLPLQIPVEQTHLLSRRERDVVRADVQGVYEP